MDGSAVLDDGRTARWRFSGPDDGDLAVDAPEPGLSGRRAALAPGPWSWLRQVHDAAVWVVGEPGDHAGREGDGTATGASGAVLAVHTADCVPVVLWSPAGVVGAAHAGWRGLVAGVVGATVDAMRALGATEVRATVGPHIGPECYRFGDADLAVVADRFGPAVRGRTSGGEPALDLRPAVTAALDEAGVVVSPSPVVCTACDPARFSHRARRDAGRHAAVVWIDP